MKLKFKDVKRYGGALAFVIILALGWRYPWLAYCMFLNVAVGLFDAVRHGGRHGCGNFCPRGAFYSLLPDTKRKVPAGLLKRKTSILVMIVMVAGLAVWLRPTTFRSVGMLLYIMIVITTSIGLIGWALFNRYFWCSICPMGKIYKMIQPEKKRHQRRRQLREVRTVCEGVSVWLLSPGFGKRRRFSQSRLHPLSALY